MANPDRNAYRSPLVARNASPEMAELFGERTKYVIHRRLWVALAEAEKQLGLPITDRQIRQLRANVENIDFKRADKYEREIGLELPRAIDRVHEARMRIEATRRELESRRTPMVTILGRM